MRSSGGHGSCRKERAHCAIYTRKSSNEGPEQGCSIRCRRSARPASQGHEGWVCLSQGYNDGGFSGAAMDRSVVHGAPQPVLHTGDFEHEAPSYCLEVFLDATPTALAIDQVAAIRGLAGGPVAAAY